MVALMNQIISESSSKDAERKYRLLWKFTQTDAVDGDSFDKLEAREFGGKVPEKIFALMNKASNENDFIQMAMNADAPDKIIIFSDNTEWKLKKVDSTHFAMMRSDSNDWKNAWTYHIGEHRGRPYYNDIKSWLHGAGNPDGKRY